MKRTSSSNGRAVDLHLAAPGSNPYLGTLKIQKDAHATYHSIMVVGCEDHEVESNIQILDGSAKNS